MIKGKIGLRKRKCTVYGRGRAVVELPSPGIPDKPLYRILGRGEMVGWYPPNIRKASGVQEV